jgi:hypothetical protein
MHLVSGHRENEGGREGREEERGKREREERERGKQRAGEDTFTKNPPPETVAEALASIASATDSELALSKIDSSITVICSRVPPNDPVT